jgi:hypothetical protein
VSNVTDKQVDNMKAKRNRMGSVSVGLELVIVALQLNVWFQLVAFMPALLGVAANVQQSAKC